MRRDRNKKSCKCSNHTKSKIPLFSEGYNSECSTCGEEDTCCNGQCCPQADAVCCPGGDSCCPADFECDTLKDRCVQVDVVVVGEKGDNPCDISKWSKFQ